MKVTGLQISKRLKDAKTDIFPILRKGIKNNKRILITAPVGTGKTTLIITLTREYVKKGYKILVLEPQIAITDQVYNKMLKYKALSPFIYNSKTRKSLPLRHTNVFLSTIDSAYKLFEQGLLAEGKTLVLFDEAHSLLQHSRKDFDTTVEKIIESGFPVIGFSATESAWVSTFVLKFQQKIEISLYPEPKKTIETLVIDHSIAATIASMIKNERYKKVLIFTETIRFQKILKSVIEKVLPQIRVIMINATTREKEEKTVWAYLMQKDKLPSSKFVVICNSVAQAGININNPNLDSVMLVGKFDPLGFLQYLGRARNYHRNFIYIPFQYGAKHLDIPDSYGIESLLKDWDNFLNQSDFKTLVDSLNLIDPNFKRFYRADIGGKAKLNRCMVANTYYQKYTQLKGVNLLKYLTILDPSIEIEQPVYLKGINVAKTIKKKYRAKQKSQLPVLIEQNSEELLEVLERAPSMTYNDLQDFITKMDLKQVLGKLAIPRDLKHKLLKTVIAAKNAGISGQHLLFACKKFVNSNKDRKILKATLAISNRKIDNYYKAKDFFNNVSSTDPTFRKIIDVVEKKVGSSNTMQDWYTLFKNSFGSLPGIEHIVRNIFRFACSMKPVQVTVKGKRKKKQKLTGVFRSFAKYETENHLL